MISNLEAKLSAHLEKKPKQPKKRTMILRDASPEAIAWHLHDVHRSAGLMSDEGGQILSGRAVGQLPMLNTLWDGGDLVVNRKDAESFTVREARLTLNVLVQYQTFKDFIKRRGRLARDNGFFARALICDPASTQGQRPIRSIETATFPKLEVFQKRLTELLSQGRLPAKEGGVI